MDEKDADGNWSKFVTVDGAQIPSRSWRLFNSILGREAGPGSYSDVAVHHDFKDYHFFAKWCNKQKGYDFKENGKFWHLDKDLLFPDQRMYGPDNCVFLPSCINMLISAPCADSYEAKFTRETEVRNLAELYKKYLSEIAYKALLKWEP